MTCADPPVTCWQTEQDAVVSETSPHIANIGRLVEDMENKIRNTLNEIYFGEWPPGQGSL